MVPRPEVCPSVAVTRSAAEAGRDARTSQGRWHERGLPAGRQGEGTVPRGARAPVWLQGAARAEDAGLRWLSARWGGRGHRPGASSEHCSGRTSLSPPQVWVFCSALCIQDVPGHGVDVCLFWPPRPTPAVLCTPICLSLRSTSVPSLCSLCPFLLSRGRVRAGVHFRHACSGRYAECWGEGPRGPIPAMMPTEPHGSGPPRGSAKEVSEEKAGPGPSAAHLEGPPAPSHRGRWPLPVFRRDRLCMRVFSRWRSRSPRGPQHVVLASG